MLWRLRSFPDFAARQLSDDMAYRQVVRQNAPTMTVTLFDRNLFGHSCGPDGAGGKSRPPGGEAGGRGAGSMRGGAKMKSSGGARKELAAE
jgi:hypothetical protein